MQTQTSVILAGKCDSLRHSTKSFGGNFLVAERSYQMLEDLSLIFRIGRYIKPVPIFLVKKLVNEALQDT